MSPNGRPGVTLAAPCRNLETAWGRCGGDFGVRGCHFIRLGMTSGARLEVLNRLGDALGLTVGSVGASLYDLLAKYVLVISTPLCSGIAAFECLGAQVDAVRAKKSHPN